MTTTSSTTAIVPGSAKDIALQNLLGTPIGKNAEAPVIAAMKQVMQASLSNQWRAGTEVGADSKTFRQIFFPSNQPTALSALVPGYTGLSSSDLESYINVVLLQAMVYWTTANTLVAGLDSDRVNADVARFSDQIFKHMGFLGAQAVAQDNKISTLAATAQAAGATVGDLIQAIIKIIPSRILLHHDSQWINGDLEIFDWVGKYLAMGGTVGEISGFLTTLYNNHLPEFPNMSASTFNLYSGYTNRSAGPTYTDFAEIKPTLVYTKWVFRFQVYEVYTGMYIGNAQMAQSYRR